MIINVFNYEGQAGNNLKKMKTQHKPLLKAYIFELEW